MQIITNRIDGKQLEQIAAEDYGTMVKGVADLRRRLIVLGGELHADGETLLLEHGSAQEDLWGFNIHMGVERGARLEFTSFVNIRPGQGNRSMEVADPVLRERIREIVDALVE